MSTVHVPASVPHASALPTVIRGDTGTVSIPGWITDLESFRRWAETDERPDKIRVGFFDGKVWVDLSKEQILTHNQVKAEFAFVLGGLARSAGLGRFYPDGAFLTNAAANLASIPDGLFASWQTLRARQLQMVEGARAGFVELEGTPDMVLEVISDSSIEKDDTILRELYWKAGIAEYWLADARKTPPRFDIFHWTKKAYVVTRRQAGWLPSTVFGRSFRLKSEPDPLGDPQFVLEMRQ